MRLLLLLLGKDLRRLRRNPWVLVINLSLPFLICALMGLAFGGGSSDRGVGTIKIAVVDEDDSALSNFLRSALQQGEAREFLQPAVMSREEALRQLRENRISAAVILPAHFALDYLEGRSGIRLELIKNPAQSFHPAIVEELLGVLVEGLNALALNLREELSVMLDVFRKDAALPDFLALSRMYAKLDERSRAVRDYLSPPLVTYTKEERNGGTAPGTPRGMSSTFAFLLPGMASMFLLFMADTLMRDLLREVRFGTLDRFRTLHDRLLVFIGAKVLTTLLVVFVGGMILFFVSALIFRFEWHQAPVIGLLLFGYAVAAVGLMAFCDALARSERRADVLNITLVIGLSFLGGAYFPASNLPSFFHEHVSGHLPNYWFIEAVRAVHFEDATDWWVPVAKLSSLGVLLLLLGAAMLRRQLLKGGKS